MMSSSIDTKFGVIDQPVKNNGQDYLKLKDSAKALGKFIEFTPTPMTIGIQGSWGTGKSSLLNMVEDEIELVNKKEKFVHIKVNAWEHSLLSIPEESLFKIVNDVITKIPGTKGITNRAESLLKQATRLGAASMGSAVSNVAEEILSSSKNSIRELKKDLESTLEKASFEKAIIYIDDLDRINPPSAVAILELLKNIFDLNKCIFVLAIDYDVVVKGLRSKYNEQSSDNEYEYRAFFDKIIQLPFQMPVAQYSIGKYVEGLMQKINYFKKDELEEDDIKEIEFVCKNTIGENPRSIKRLINYLSLIQILQSQKGKDFDDKEEKLMLFCILSLQIAYPDIYSVIERDPIFKVDKILSENHGFSGWNKDVAFKHTHLKEEGSSEEEKKKFENELKLAEHRESPIYDDDGGVEIEKLFDEEWEQILFRICYPKTQLRNSVDELSRFLNYFYDTFIEVETDEKDREEKYQKNLDLYFNVLNISSVTSVTSGQEVAPKIKKIGIPTYFDNVENYFNQLIDEETFDTSYNEESRKLLERCDGEIVKIKELEEDYKNETLFRMISGNGVSFNYKNKRGGKFLNISGGRLQPSDRTKFQDIGRSEDFESHNYYIDIDLLKQSIQFKNNCQKKLGFQPFTAKNPEKGEFYTVRLFTEKHINDFLKSGLILDALNARKTYQSQTIKDQKNPKKQTIASVRKTYVGKSKKDKNRILDNELLEYYRSVKL